MQAQGTAKPVDGGCLATFTSCFKPKRKAAPQAPIPLQEAPISVPEAPTTLPEASTTSPEVITPLPNTPTPLPETSTPLLETSTPLPEAPTPVPETPSSLPQPPTGESKLWLEALEKTDNETKKLLKEFLSPADDDVQIAELVQIVREREKKFKDETPRLKIGDREIIWRDYASRVVGWLTDIGDLAIPFAPKPSSTVWSALKVLLKAHVSQCTDLIAILGCAEKVLRVVKRGKIYEVVYLQETADNPTAGDSYLSAEGLRGTLIDVYQKSIELLAHTAGQLNSGGGKRFIDALKNPGEGDGLVQDLFKAEQKLGLAVQACEAEHSQIANAKNRELLERLHEPLRYVHEGVSALLQDMEQRDILEALDFISKVDIARQHDERTKLRIEGTCEWLLQDPEFERWESSDSSSILWLKGRVGTGKSTLTSKVIDRYRINVIRLMEKLGRAEGPAIDEPFAFFYCSNRDVTIKDDILLHAYSSYVRQLATVPHYPRKMETGLVQLYQTMRKQSQKFQIEDCQARIQELVDLFPRTTLVLDALDECDKKTKKALISFFGKLIKDSKRVVRIFISSREEDDILRLFREHDLFQGERLVEITVGHSNQDDMKKYLDAEMEEIGDDWSFKAKEAVMKKLLEANDGMFRWTYLQMEQLKCFKSNEAILDRLGRLPKGLSEAYNELYDSNQGVDQVLLQRVVKWTKHAKRELSEDELLAAVRVHVGKDDSGRHHLKLSDTLNEAQLASICRHLLVKRKYGPWKFPHASVIEYFEEEHADWLERDAQAEMAKICLVILIDGYTGWSLPEFPVGEYVYMDRRQVHGYLDAMTKGESRTDPVCALREYAKSHWNDHVQMAQTSEEPCWEVSRLLQRFMIAEGKAWRPSPQFLQWYRHCQLRSYQSNRTILASPIENPAFAIWAFGLYEAAKMWPNFKVNLKQVNHLGYDPLSIAIASGQDELCRTLVEMGSGVNAIARDGRSRLARAADTGQLACAKVLLSLGADPNPDILCRPLCLAAQGRGRSRIVDLLLEHGANPNAKCARCNFGYPLLAAANYDDFDSAKRLIQAGANLDVRSNDLENLLDYTARWGSYGCLGLFIANGLDPHTLVNKARYGWVLKSIGVVLGGDDEEKSDSESVSISSRSTS